MREFPLKDMSDKQFDSMLESVSRLNIWEGSVRSGKTVASIVRWAEFIKKAPSGGVLLMIGKTHKTLERNIIAPMLELFPDAEFKRGTHELHIFGKIVEVVGASDERAQDKIRGSTCAGAYGDELTLWPESFFTMLLSRLSVKGAKFFGTTNPDGPYHWLKMNYLDRAHELDMTVFHFEIDDNTFLDPSYVRSLKLEYTGLWYKRFIEGLWVQAEGAIYDMYDPDVHVIDVHAVIEAAKQKGDYRLKPWRYFVAIDYGTSNPFAAGLFAYKVGTTKTYMVKEFCYDGRKMTRQKTDAQYADDIIQFISGYQIGAVYVDPSALSFITELKTRGLPVEEAKNDVLDGIRFVSNYLSAKMFFIDKSCAETQREFPGYVWDTKAQSHGEDKPIKANDHFMDMIRYALFTHFFRAAPVRIVGLNYK